MPSRLESGESYLLFAGNILKYFTVYHSYLHATIKTLPVLNQHLLPYDLPHDLSADTKQFLFAGNIFKVYHHSIQSKALSGAHY